MSNIMAPIVQTVSVGVLNPRQVQELLATKSDLESQVNAIHQKISAIRTLLGGEVEGESEESWEDVSQAEVQAPQEEALAPTQATPISTVPATARPSPSDVFGTLTGLIQEAVRVKPGSTPMDIKNWILAHAQRNTKLRQRVMSAYFYKAVHRMAKSGTIRKDGHNYYPVVENPVRR